MTQIISVILAMIIVALPSSVVGQDQSLEKADSERIFSEMPFCHFELDPFIRRSSTSFYLVYRLEFSTDGTVKSVELLKGNYVEKQAIEECSQSWFMPNTGGGESDIVTVTQYWKHGVGWEWMNVMLANRSIKVRNLGNAEPYLRDS